MVRVVEIEYRKLFNLGNYENQAISLRASLDEGEDLEEAFKRLYVEVHKLHNRSFQLKRLEEIDDEIEALKEKVKVLEDLKTKVEELEKWFQEKERSGLFCKIRSLWQRD